MFCIGSNFYYFATNLNKLNANKPDQKSTNLAAGVKVHHKYCCISCLYNYCCELVTRRDMKCDAPNTRKKPRSFPSEKCFRIGVFQNHAYLNLASSVAA